MEENTVAHNGIYMSKMQAAGHKAWETRNKKRLRKQRNLSVSSLRKKLLKIQLELNDVVSRLEVYK